MPGFANWSSGRWTAAFAARRTRKTLCNRPSARFTVATPRASFVLTLRLTSGACWRRSRGARFSSMSKSWVPGNGIPKREEYTEGDDLLGQGPTPEEAAIAADLMEKALAGLDETFVEILHLRLQDCTEEEIAAKLGYSRSLVRSKLNRIRDRLERLSGEDSGK